MGSVLLALSQLLRSVHFALGLFQVAAAVLATLLNRRLRLVTLAHLSRIGRLHRLFAFALLLRRNILEHGLRHDGRELAFEIFCFLARHECAEPLFGRGRFDLQRKLQTGVSTLGLSVCASLFGFGLFEVEILCKAAFDQQPDGAPLARALIKCLEL